MSAQTVDINAADQQELMSLPGIGAVKAKAIVSYRQTHGAFSSIEGIMQVSGIGQATFDNIKELITVGNTQPDSGSASQTPASSTDPTTATRTTQATTTLVSSYVPPPLPILFADAGSDRSVIVGADVEFDGRAYDRDQRSLDESTTRFLWNFGDGSTAEGPGVLHHFAYPGVYAVVLSIANDHFAVSDEIKIIAEPAALSLVVLPDGGISIGNDSGHDLDLSNWIVRESGSPFTTLFTLPAHSIVLASSSLRISPQTLSFRATVQSSLAYPNGVAALAARGSEETASTTTDMSKATTEQLDRSRPVSIRVPQYARPTISPPAPSSREPIVASHEPLASTSDAVQDQHTQVASAGVFGANPWWLGALGFVGAGAAALVISRRFASREWDIIEEKGE